MKKTMIFKIFIILLAFFAGFGTFYSSNEFDIINLDNTKNTSSTITSASIDVNNIYLDVSVNDTLALNLTTNSDLSIKSYKSLNTYILEVSEKGVVYGKHIGTGSVLVTLSDNSTKTYNINVCANPQSIEIYSSSNYLVEGESTKVVATVSPVGSNRNVTYSSDNENVNVQEDGSIIINSNATGSVTVSATTVNGITTSKTFTILECNSYTAGALLSSDYAVSINQGDIENNNGTIDLYCNTASSSFEEAPTYYVLLNDLYYESNKSGSIITILADGYVNIVFKVCGNIHLIGKDYLGIQLTSNRLSDDPHAKIIFESNETKRSISIGYSLSLSEDEESGLGNIEFSLKENILSNVDIKTLANSFNALSGSNQKIEFDLFNNLYKTVKFSDTQATYGYVSDQLDIKYTINETEGECRIAKILDDTNFISVESDKLSLKQVGQSLFTLLNEDYPYIYDFIIISVYEDISSNISIDDLTTIYETNELIKDESYTLNVSDSKYIIESSDDSIINVNDDLTITALNSGNVTLSVYYKNNTLISATKEYKVVIKENNIEYINGLYDNYPIYVNNTFDLSKHLQVLPLDATYKTLSYLSNDETVITIDDTGLLKAISKGSASITVTSKSGITTNIIFKVLIPVTEIETDINATKTIERGQTFDLSSHITVLPLDASNKEVLYSSSDTSIATVDETGLITALGKGDFSITVTSVDNNTVSKTIYFTSYVSVKSIDTSKLDGSTTIYDKGTLDLSNLIRVLPLDATNTDLKYLSSDTSILSVDESGLVKALKSGKAIITITASDNVSIEIEIESYIKATSIEIELNTTKIEKGTTLDLLKLITVSPIDSTNKSLTFRSSDSAILSISEDGVIEGLKEGTSTITILQAEVSKEITFECLIKVSGIKKTNETTLNAKIEKGENLDITNYFNVLPLDATHKEVSYLINDTSIATVSDEGIIQTLSKGHFTLTVTTTEGSYFLSFELEVYVSVKDIYVEVPDNNIFRVNETYQINAHVLPVDANVQTLNYYTTTNKATVNSNGLVTFVEIGKDNGEVKITIRSNESSIEKTLTLYVVQPVTDIKINSGDNVVLPIGETYKLNYTVYPTNASNKEVKFTSSNISIASISSEGVITSLSIGEVVITIETLDGGYKDSITLYCGPHVESIEILNTETIVKVGDTIQIKVTVSPLNAANSKFTYSTSNSDIASITDSGVLTAHRTGQVRITVTTIDSGKVSSITLNVKNVQDKPNEIVESNVVVSNNSIVIMNPLSTVEYRLLDKNSNVVYDWTTELVNNKIIFDDLSDDSNYTIEYRTIGTAYKDTSEALSFSVKTEKNEFVKLNTGLIVLMFIGGVLVLGLVIFFILKSIKKKKKNV